MEEIGVPGENQRPFDYEVSSSLILRQLNWQTVSERRDFLIGTLMYKCLSDNAPCYLSDRFTSAREVHDYQTRQVSDDALNVPFAQTQYYQRSLAVVGPKLWNGLPNHIQKSESTASFKYLYKRHLQTL